MLQGHSTPVTVDVLGRIRNCTLIVILIVGIWEALIKERVLLINLTFIRRHVKPIFGGTS